MIDTDDLGAPRVGLKTQVESDLSSLAARTPLHGGPFQLICISDSEESNDLVIMNNQTKACKPTSNTDKDNNTAVICESGEVVDLTDPVENCNDINKNPENNHHTSINKCDAEILKQKEDVCLSDVTCESVLTIARNDTEILKMLEEHFHFPNDVNNLEKEHDELVPKINNEYVNSTAEVDVIQNGNAFSTNSPDSNVSVSEDSVGTKDTFNKLLKTTFPSVESLLDAIKDAEDAENADADVNGYKDNRKTKEKLDNVDGVVPEIINPQRSSTEEQVTSKEQISESMNSTPEKQQEQEEENKESDFDEMREEVVRELNNLCNSFQSSSDEHNDKCVEAEDITNYQDIVDELEKNERAVENHDDNIKVDDIRESQDFGTIEGDLPIRSEATEEITLVDRPKSAEETETITIGDSPKSAEATEEITLDGPPKSLEATKEIALDDPHKSLEEITLDDSEATEEITSVDRPKSAEKTETIIIGDSPKSAEATEEITLDGPPKSLEATKEIAIDDSHKSLEEITLDDSEATKEFTLVDRPKSAEGTETITLGDSPKSAEAIEEFTLDGPPKRLEEITLDGSLKRLEATKDEISSDESFKTADVIPIENKLESKLEDTGSCEKESDQNISTCNEEDKQQTKNNSESTLPPVSLHQELEENQKEVDEDRQQTKNNPESTPPPVSLHQELEENQKEVDEDRQQTKNNPESTPPPVSLHQELEENQKEVDEDRQQTKNNPESTPPPVSLHQELEENQKEVDEDRQQTKNNPESTPPPVSLHQELEENQKEVDEDRQQTKNNSESTPPPSLQQELEENQKEIEAVDTPKENSDNAPIRRKVGRPKNKRIKNKKSTTAISNSSQDEKIICGNVDSVSDINDAQENKEEDSDTNPKQIIYIAPEIITIKEEPNLSNMESETSSKAHSRTHSKPTRTTEKRELKSSENAKTSEEISDKKESRSKYDKRNPTRRKTIYVEDPTDRSENKKEILLEKENLTTSHVTIKNEHKNKDDEITSSKNYSDTPSRIKVRKRGRPKSINKLNNSEKNINKNNEENIQERSSTEAVKQQLIKIEDNEIQKIPKKKGRPFKVKRNIQTLSESKEEKGEKKIAEERKRTRLSPSKVLSPVQVVKRGRGRPPKDPSKGKVNESPANLHKNKTSNVDHSLTRITRRTSEINKVLSNNKSSDTNLRRTKESISKRRIERENSFNDKKGNSRKRKYPSSDNSSQDEENSGNETEKTEKKNYSPLRKYRRSLDKKINLNKQQNKILNNPSNQNNNNKEVTEEISVPLKKRGRPRKHPLIENKKVMIFKRGRGRPRNSSRSNERYYCQIEKDEDLNPVLANSPIVVLKKIGRPRKSLRNSNNLNKIKHADNDIDIDTNETNLPKRRGRPPKYKKKEEIISTIRKNKSYSKDRSSNLHKRKSENISDLESNVSPRRKRRKISEKYEDDEEEELLFKECFLNWKPDQSAITEQLYNNNNTPMVKIENFVPDMAIESGALSKISGPLNNNNLSTCSTEIINQQIVKTEFSENLDKLKMLDDDVNFFNSLLPYIESLSEKNRFLFKLKIQKLTTELIKKDRKYSSL